VDQLPTPTTITRVVHELDGLDTDLALLGRYEHARTGDTLAADRATRRLNAILKWLPATRLEIDPNSENVQTIEMFEDLAVGDPAARSNWRIVRAWLHSDGAEEYEVYNSDIAQTVAYLFPVDGSVIVESTGPARANSPVA
jgi:hypothetical protein